MFDLHQTVIVSVIHRAPCRTSVPRRLLLYNRYVPQFLQIVHIGAVGAPTTPKGRAHWHRLPLLLLL